MLCFYLGCCQLALCVKHTVAGCGAGKEGKRNLDVVIKFFLLHILNDISDSNQGKTDFL